MNPGLFAGLLLIAVGVLGAVIGQFVVRNDRDQRSTRVRSYMLLSLTIGEVASILLLAIVVTEAEHTISIVLAAAWLAAWSYLTAAEWRRFIRDHTNR